VKCWRAEKSAEGERQNLDLMKKQSGNRSAIGIVCNFSSNSRNSRHPFWSKNGQETEFLQILQAATGNSRENAFIAVLLFDTSQHQDTGLKGSPEEQDQALPFRIG